MALSRRGGQQVSNVSEAAEEIHPPLSRRRFADVDAAKSKLRREADNDDDVVDIGWIPMMSVAAAAAAKDRANYISNGKQ